MENNNSLEKILEKTVNVLDESQKDIFAIAESSRKEFENIKKELECIKLEINEVVDKLDALERKNRRARLKLMEVSKDFNSYSEIDIKNAYREAEESSVEIAVIREKEEQLIRRRRKLETSLLNLQETVEKAENFVSKVSVIKEFLNGQLSSLSDEFDDLRQKNNLAIKVIQAQEEERKRLAREIHDGPAQSIANLVFRVELSQKLLDKDIDKARNELDELKDLIRLSMQDIRKIIYNLRPMSLDDLGLIPTLKKYIDNYTKESDIIIAFNVLGDQRRLSSTFEVTIFRLIQEALNNIFKHANASSGKIRLEYCPERVNILISDDGIGFDCSEIDEDKYGLISMRERCNLLGGEISIKSAHDKGTIIKILLPIKRCD
ncbi:sensor histidine kinase [Natronospora cellulosivora (SeqCode)]